MFLTCCISKNWVQTFFFCLMNRIPDINLLIWQPNVQTQTMRLSEFAQKSHYSVNVNYIFVYEIAYQILLVVY